MKVPFLDLKSQYLSIQDEIKHAIESVLNATAFASGPFVADFEKQFASAHQVPFCIGVNSGTSALHAALWALEIGPGDEVIVPVNTFIATAEAVSLTGAKPVFVDCDDRMYHMDSNHLSKARSKKTRAIIPVHLYGQPVDMAPIMEFAGSYGLKVVEDCAQAHIALIKEKPVGGFGQCGCFSFYPGKNLGAYGEAGAVTTTDPALSEKILMYRDHGSKIKYHHDYIGHNYRMEGIQGAVLGVKMKHLNEWTEARIRAAQVYNELLADVPQVTVPQILPGIKHVYHLYVIRCDKRDLLQTFLIENGISTGLHYPVPLHMQKAYKHLKYKKGDFPVAEKCADQILSLPMYPEIQRDQLVYVTDKIREFYKK